MIPMLQDNLQVPKSAIILELPSKFIFQNLENKKNNLFFRQFLDAFGQNQKTKIAEFIDEFIDEPFLNYFPQSHFR